MEDLCRFIDRILEEHPRQHIFNVGNESLISIRDWVSLCYEIMGKKADFVTVDRAVAQRKYFPFYDYEYFLDVKKEKALLPELKPLLEGLRESLAWYLENKEMVNKKPLLQYIDECL